MPKPAVAAIPTPISRRLADLRRGFLPLLVWLVAAVGSGLLLVRLGRQPACIGWAPPVLHEISTSMTGRVAEAHVELFGSVRRGQFLVQLDDSELTVQIRAAQAEIERLRAELAAARWQSQIEQDRQSRDNQVEARRLITEEENNRLDSLAISVELEADRVERQRLLLKAERFQELVGAKSISQMEYDDTRLLAEEVSTRIAHNETLLDQTRNVWNQAQRRRESFESQSSSPRIPDPWLDSIQRAISENEKLALAIGAQRQSLTLFSPVDGQITALAVGPGQAVVPGEALLVVTEAVPRQLVAYLRDADIHSVQPAMHVEVLHSDRDGPRIRARVVSIGAATEQLPLQLWRDPTRPEFGLPMIIGYDPAMNLVPGEKITVRLNRES